MYVTSVCNIRQAALIFRLAGPACQIVRGFELLGNIQDAHPRHDLKVQPARISLKWEVETNTERRVKDNIIIMNLEEDIES